MSVELKSPTEQVEQVRLPTLLTILKKKYGEEWFELEDETISLDMGLAFTPLLVDKINVLRILVLAPELFYDDYMFFAHACDVMSNIPADFEVFPQPNSLQIAWAVKEVRNLVDGTYSDGLKDGITKILKEEGYSTAPGPLLEVSFPEKLVEGQEPEDRQAKEEAINQYIAHMEKSS